MSKISRRSFLKKAGAATAAATLGPAIITLTPKTVKAAPSPLNKWPGRCVLDFNNQHAATVNGGTTSDQAILKKMADDSIKLLTGLDDVGEAWKSVFPAGFNETKTIAIKISILTTDTTPPHPFVIMGITEGLQQMDFNGTKFPAGNITIYDAGNNFTSGGFISSRFGSVNIRQTSFTATGGARNLRYANVLADSDYLINVAGLRGHGSGYGSVTLGFKSHYGTYPNPSNYHSTTHEYLRDFTCTGPVFNKLALTVVDGIYALNLGHGPTGSPDNYATYAKTMDSSVGSSSGAHTVIFSTDPVTAEFQALKVMRINAGQVYNTNSMPNYLKVSAGISVASVSGNVYNIGVIDESNMDYREIVNGSVTTSIRHQAGWEKNNAPGIGRLLVSPVPATSVSYIDYIVSERYMQQKAHVDIITPTGKAIKRFIRPVMGIRNRITWDLTSEHGKRIPEGNYLIKVTVGNSVSLKSTVIVK